MKAPTNTQCLSCPKTRNQVNGLYCTFWNRYVEWANYCPCIP